MRWWGRVLAGVLIVGAFGSGCGKSKNADTAALDGAVRALGPAYVGDVLADISVEPSRWVVYALRQGADVEYAMAEAMAVANFRRHDVAGHVAYERTLDGRLVRGWVTVVKPTRSGTATVAGHTVHVRSGRATLEFRFALPGAPSSDRALPPPLPLRQADQTM
jgi:hypothetical protein